MAVIYLMLFSMIGNLEFNKLQAELIYFDEIIGSSYNGPIKINAYWEKYLVYLKLKDDVKAADALFLFKGNAKEYLEWVEESSLNFTWVDETSLKKKLLYAETMLEAYWFSDNNYTCRTLETSCEIFNSSFIGLFLLKVPFCKNKISNIKFNGFEEIMVDVNCLNGTNEKYYFVIHE